MFYGGAASLVWYTSRRFERGCPTILLYALAFAINTVLIVILQLPLSRGTDEIAKAAKASAYAGVLMFAVCVVYALSAVPMALSATVLLLVAVVGHTLAEILSSACTWGLSHELADRSRAGADQGVFATGTALGGIGAPIVSALVVSTGIPGWRSRRRIPPGWSRRASARQKQQRCDKDVCPMTWNFRDISHTHAMYRRENLLQ